MAAPEADTEELLRRAEHGDESAVGPLLDRHRKRLCQMVAVRMDPRLAVRVDPSDVVQEALGQAAQRLPEYLRDRPLPFYPWLRRLAWQRLVDLYRYHIQSQRRSLRREEPMEMPMPDQSVLALVDRIASSQTSPSRDTIRREVRHRVRTTLDRLSPDDREVLVLVYLEQLSAAEAGDVLGISEKAATMRHLRALDRLRRLLNH
jgi:RNA polymerase sigma-70 factor (ECF subfamily)